MFSLYLYNWISPFHLSTGIFKRLDHGSNNPTKPLRALARTPVARDDTVCSLLALVSGPGACFQKTGSRVSHPRGAPSARDDTVLWHVGVCFGSGWMFLKDWITGQATPEGPRLPGMTQYIAWWTCYGGTFPPSNILLILSILLSAFYYPFHLSTNFHQIGFC